MKIYCRPFKKFLDFYPVNANAKYICSAVGILCRFYGLFIEGYTVKWSVAHGNINYPYAANILVT